MARQSNQDGFIQERLAALFASLLFSVPTAGFIWLAMNKQLALFNAGFFSSGCLIGSISIFSLFALVFPKLFPSLLGAIWRGILKIERWWGW